MLKGIKQDMYSLAATQHVYRFFTRYIHTSVTIYYNAKQPKLQRQVPCNKLMFCSITPFFLQFPWVFFTLCRSPEEWVGTPGKAWEYPVCFEVTGHHISYFDLADGKRVWELHVQRWRSELEVNHLMEQSLDSAFRLSTFVMVGNCRSTDGSSQIIQ